MRAGWERQGLVKRDEERRDVGGDGGDERGRVEASDGERWQIGRKMMEWEGEGLGGMVNSWKGGLRHGMSARERGWKGKRQGEPERS